MATLVEKFRLDFALHSRLGLTSRMKSLRRVAVLGAGTIGSRIAAHFANAGVPALLLDVVIPGQANRNAAALKGIENAVKQRPGGFFADDKVALVQPGNFEDHLDQIAECDWIV